MTGKENAEMKTRWWVMGFVVATVPAFAWAQSLRAGEHPRGKLTRVVPEGQSEQDAQEFDRDAWKKQITARDLAERESAFDRLAGIARRDPAAREALEAWSRDDSDAELAWTSRLILRETGRGSLGGSPNGWGAFGRGFDMDGFSERFDDLDLMFGELRADWDSMLEKLPHPSNGSWQEFDGSKSMTLQSGPDGVTCKITEDVDGKETTREYKAKTIEELLDANPELRSRIGGDGAQVWTFPHGGFQGRMLTPRSGGKGGSGVYVLPPSQRDGTLFGGVTPARPPSTMGKSGEVRTDRLGIYCEVVDEGLRVESTEPGSIASVLGLRAGDVVVEMNGTSIHAQEDVKKVLADRDEDAELSVVVEGTEGRRTLTWKPAAKKNETSEPKGSRKL